VRPSLPFHLLHQEIPRMSRLNNIIKFVLLNMNILMCFIGSFFVGLAFYLWFADFGSLSKSFFIGVGFISALFGLVLGLLSCIGCQGINNQTRKFGFYWTGRRIIALHCVCLILGLIGEVFVLKTALDATEKYSSVYDDLSKGLYPNYVSFESTLAQKFNEFFFGAASVCKTTLYLWFWDWVNHNCPSTINQLWCQGCESYSLTFCQASDSMCVTDEFGNAYCPYTICRAGLLHYFEYRIRPFAYTLLAMIFLQIAFIFMDIMILCFHPRDSLHKILEKSGTLNPSREYGHLTV